MYYLQELLLNFGNYNCYFSPVVNNIYIYILHIHKYICINYIPFYGHVFLINTVESTTVFVVRLTSLKMIEGKQSITTAVVSRRRV